MEDLNSREVHQAIKLITENSELSENQKADLINNLWKINYIVKPPTMEEFLTPSYIGAVADKLHDHVREVLIEFMNPSLDNTKRVLALSTHIGFGKMQSLNSKIFTPEGFKRMGDICLGDEVCTPNGKTAKVQYIFPQGKKSLYEVTFKDGRKTLAGAEHLWKTANTITHFKNKPSKPAWKLCTTQEIFDKLYAENQVQSSTRWRIPLTDPVAHKETKHYLSPYIIGSLLGDGYLPKKSVITFTSEDLDSVAKLRQDLPLDYQLKQNSFNKIQYTFVKKDINSKNTNLIKKEIKRLNLLGTKSLTKFIPDEYLYDSIPNRIALLQGLMDTDGSADKQRGRTKFDTISPHLRDGIIQLVRSLGGTASYTLTKRKNPEKYKNQEYTVFISFPNNNFPLFKLTRKQERVDNKFNRKRARSNTQFLYIIKIEKVQEDYAQCIMLDDEDHLYLTDDYIVTHNSTLSTILVLFIMVHLSYMRNPKKFFNLNEMGSLVAVLLSFTLKKANQTLLQPFVQLLKASPIFHQTRTEDGLANKQKAIPIDHIAYTTAGRMGAVQLSKDIHIVVISDRASLLGMNIFAGIASEISFWIEKGIGVEEIWGTFQDLRNRINNRFNHSYLTATILDSSPIDIDLSPIDKWLYTPGEADSDPEVMFVNAKTWESFPEKFPIWLKTGETFSVYRGSGAKPPKILYDEKELEEYDADEIYAVPIDAKLAFEQNLKKKIADDCAYPAGGLLKLFEAYHYIDDIFSLILKNVPVAIEIPEERDPTHLIWDQIKDRFFIYLGNGVYEFYRSPMEKRSIHIDLSETGDISGIGMSHKEFNLKGETIIIHDFLIPLHKGQTRINIDAVIEFVLDLKRIGRIKIYKVTADSYQSATMLQRLRREGIDADKLSVDKETGPYMVYSSWVKSGKVKSGRSIHLKNNLKSLVEYRRDSGSIKIEHIQGQPIYIDSGSWTTSQVGYRAKDISDVACGSAYNLIIDTSLPKYTFDDRITEASSEASKQKILKGIHNRLSLKPRSA